MTDTKKIYFWNMMGSMCNALSSIIFLMIVTRTVNDYQADCFSVGFAIAQLMLTVATFQVRVFQSTDVEEQYSFSEYFLFRIVTSVVMICVASGYIMCKGYSGEKACVVFLLCLFRMVDAIADVFEGLFQQKMRLDLSGKFLTLRIVPAIVVFTVFLGITKNLVVGCISIVVITLVITIGFCLKYTREFATISFAQYSFKELYRMVSGLTIKCFPIFINGFLISLIYNIPKNSIDSASTKGLIADGMQTIYNIIFMPGFAISLLFIFFRPQITQMAVLLHEKLFDKLNKTIGMIAFFIIAFTAAFCIGGYLLGAPILSILYGKDINPYKVDLVCLLIGGGLGTLATLWDNVLTILRKQYLTTIGYIASAIGAYALADRLIYAEGVAGAVKVFVFSMVILCSVTFLIMSIELIVRMKKEKSNE